MFWAILIVMLLVAIGVLVYPLLKVRENDSLAYKDSNLKINDEKIKELDLDLKEGRIDQVFYKLARQELDKELLIDIPVENQQTAALHYTNTANVDLRWHSLSLFLSRWSRCCYTLILVCTRSVMKRLWLVSKQKDSLQLTIWQQSSKPT